MKIAVLLEHMNGKLLFFQRFIGPGIGSEEPEEAVAVDFQKAREDPDNAGDGLRILDLPGV